MRHSHLTARDGWVSIWWWWWWWQSRQVYVVVVWGIIMLWITVRVNHRVTNHHWPWRITIDCGTLAAIVDCFSIGGRDCGILTGEDWWRWEFRFQLGYHNSSNFNEQRWIRLGMPKSWNNLWVLSVMAFEVVSFGVYKILLYILIGNQIPVECWN